MSNNLENLVKQAETDISSQSKMRKTATGESLRVPKLSVAIIIWLIAILLAAYQFDDVVSIFSKPAESKVERDLGSILTNAGSSLRSFEIANGSLPHLLPNSAIRGLVKYERRSDFSFLLTATIGNVTMVLDSSSTRPHRETKAN